mgnify:CR=1 FL=1
MTDFTTLVFYINLGFLLAHELDAILQHEWRFFPFLAPFDDVTAYRLFTAAHVPLFALILWNLFVRNFQIGLDVFLIFHAGLHFVLRNHPKITFNNPFSRVWIFGAALLSGIHLGLLGLA